jgi:hypothetical protein
MKIFSIALATITMTAAATASLAATNSKSEKMATKSPESLECSKQADAKSLHGKERKKFREECKKDLKSKTSTAPPSSEPAELKRWRGSGRSAPFHVWKAELA